MIKKLYWYIFAVLAISILAGVLIVYSPETHDSSKTTLQKALAKKKIRVGYANEAPFAYQDASTGQVTGEAPEIARLLLERMGITEMEGVLTEFGSLIPGLQAKRFDMIAAGMYILPARCAQIAFSDPTYSMRDAFAVRPGNPLSIHSYRDVKDQPSARLGVVSGGVEAGHAKAVGIPQEQIITFSNVPNALEGIKSGRIDAYAATHLTISNAVKKSDGDLESATPFINPVINGQSVRDYGAFGFRKEDTDFVDAFNQELKEFIGTPEHLQLVSRFGFGHNELPGEVNVDDLCAAEK